MHLFCSQYFLVIYFIYFLFVFLHCITLQCSGCTILIVKNRKNIESEFCLSVYHWYAHGRQRRCQEDPVSLPSSRLEKTTRSSPHHVAQHRPTGSETTPPYAPRSSRFGSEPPSVEDDVDVWRCAIVRVACQKRRRRLSHFSILSK